MRRSLMRLLAAGVFVLGMGSVILPSPARAAVSLCPEPVNSYIAPDVQVAGDLDLCRWPTDSAYGDYVTVQPSPTISYTSCLAWKDATTAWAAAGRPPDATPALIASTSTRFAATVTALGKDPSRKGQFRVQIAFRPALGTPNPSRTYVALPTWPGMTVNQQQRLNQIVPVILAHEEGHQNLAGYVHKAYEEVVSVPAKNARQAEEIARTDPSWAPLWLEQAKESMYAVHDAYDTLVNHGGSQSALGGTDIPELLCGMASIVSRTLDANAATTVICDPFARAYMVRQAQNESTTYTPPPPTYSYREFNVAAFTGLSTSGCEPLSPHDTATDIPGLAARSGEPVTLSATSDQTRTIVHPYSKIPHVMGASAAATTSSTYVERAGALSLSGSNTCKVKASYATADTYYSYGGSGVEGGVSTAVSYDIFVGATAKFSLSLDANADDPNIMTSAGMDLLRLDVSLSYVLRATPSGSPYTVTLAPGTYRLTHKRLCQTRATRETGDTVKYSAVSHTATIEEVSP